MASIQGIYVALFGRPADPAGLAYFNEATNMGLDLTAIGDLAGQAEYLNRFTGMSNEQIVNSIYQALFERDGEPEGIAFFVAELEGGRLNINNIAIAILDGAQGADRAIADAKIAAADMFTASLDTPAEVAAYDNPAVGRQFLDDVTPDNLPTQGEVDAFIAVEVVEEASGPDPNPGGGGGGGSGGGGETVDITSPTFDQGSEVEVTVNEHIEAGTLIYCAKAQDDSGVITFSLATGDDGAYFTIDPATGEVAINASATMNEYQFSVVATDGAGNSSTQLVTFAITDVKYIHSESDLPDSLVGTPDGVDYFVFDSIRDSYPDDHRDVMSGFVLGQDKIYLSAEEFGAADLKFDLDYSSWEHEEAGWISVAHGMEDGNTYVMVNLFDDGNNVDFSFQMTGHVALTQADFIFA